MVRVPLLVLLLLLVFVVVVVGAAGAVGAAGVVVGFRIVGAAAGAAAGAVVSVGGGGGAVAAGAADAAAGVAGFRAARPWRRGGPPKADLEGRDLDVYPLPLPAPLQSSPPPSPLPPPPPSWGRSIKEMGGVNLNTPLGGSNKAFWAPLGPLLGVLGPSWAILRYVGSSWKPSWALRPSWSHLEPRRTLCHLGPPAVQTQGGGGSKPPEQGKEKGWKQETIILLPPTLALESLAPSQPHYPSLPP
eukprot:8040928-Pyramimonas_sp.AAC.1